MRYFKLAPYYLSKAAEESNKEERLNLIISMAISGLHHSISFKKSFDPVIGETFQATIQSETKDHSCHVYVEQTSHHPPINHFLIEDDDK